MISVDEKGAVGGAKDKDGFTTNPMTFTLVRILFRKTLTPFITRARAPLRRGWINFDSI